MEKINKSTNAQYIIYAQIGFSTNRQTFNNNIASTLIVGYIHSDSSIHIVGYIGLNCASDIGLNCATFVVHLKS